MTIAISAHDAGVVSAFIRAANDAGANAQRAAVVLTMTGIAESGLRILANPSVPSSMSIPHDGLGSDHASVGPIQQQVPSWGTAADCMDPYRSALKFLHGGGTNPGLLTLPNYRFAYVGYPNASTWTQLPNGNAAQAVQVSAYPDAYQSHEVFATAVVAQLWPQAIDTEDDTMYEVLQRQGHDDYACYSAGGAWWVPPRDTHGHADQGWIRAALASRSAKSHTLRICPEWEWDLLKAISASARVGG